MIGNGALDHPKQDASQAGSARGGCPKCRAANADDARFCRVCGVALWEKCGDCAARIRIGERFCPHCGVCIEDKVAALCQQHRSNLQQAGRLAEKYALDDAAALARRIAKAPDFRFAEIAAEAQQLLARIERDRQLWSSKADAATSAAKKCMAEHDYSGVLQRLEPIPLPLLAQDALQMLRQARSAADEWSRLKDDLKTAVQQRRFAATGALLDRLLALRPGSCKYQELAGQIGERLVASAEQHFRCGEVEQAAEELNGVARCCRGRRYAALRQKIDEIFWLREQLVKTPFITPTLAQLATRLRQLVPSDERTAQLLEKLRTRMTSRPDPPRAAFPLWSKPARDSSSPEIHVFGRFENVSCPDHERFSKSPHLFAVAIGLALQGIGEASYDIRLAEKQSAHKLAGLKKLFQKQLNTSRAWGLDIGASSLKAVCIEKSASGNVEVVASELIPFEIPLHRPDMETRGSQVIRNALEKLKAMHALAESPVWANLPARQTLVRFSQLPPFDVKQKEAMVTAEAEHQFPVSLQNLVWDGWVAPFRPGSTRPRSLVLVAAQAEAVRTRLQALREVGIEPAGIQASAIAFANTLRFEFREKVPGPDLEAEEPLSSPPALAGLDIGCEMTSMVVITPRGLWFRAFDISGDSITLAIARHRNLPYARAAQVQASVGKADGVPAIYEQVTPLFQKLWERVSVELPKARETLGGCQIAEMWAFGGPTRMHGLFNSAR